jgi:predicted phosphodiesterase
MSKSHLDRRQFLKLAGLGGAVFASGLPGWAQAQSYAAKLEDFFFVQLSDSHWGFKGAPNPDAGGTLQKAVASVNALSTKPDFVIFTGDLTHTTDDPQERRRRMAEFKQIVSALEVKDVKFIPGEHDASLDRGAAFKEFFGKTYYEFEHKGMQFFVLDNVSDPTASLGAEQLEWFRKELGARDKDARIVVFAHRPLFDLMPQWDWATRDGAKAIELMMPYRNVTVFYGHIHQEHHHATGHIQHHAAKSLIFPLPAPGSQPQRAPLPWNPAEPYRGLGFREIEAKTGAYTLGIDEFPVVKKA